VNAPPSRPPWLIVLAVAATLPGVLLRLTGGHLAPPVAALLYGLAVIGAAALLSWAAEAAEVDISAGLAIALLALIAVLPEYAIDFVFTARGGADYTRYGPGCLAPDAPAGTDSSCALALANMTGANRILVGLGWSLVVLVAALRLRQRRRDAGRPAPPRRDRVAAATVQLSRTDAVPLVFLGIASAYGLTLPLRSSITLVDFVVLGGIFVGYAVRVARAPAQEPDLIGPSAWIGRKPAAPRRTWVIGLFVLSAGVILLVAEHFADALTQTGAQLGISQFFLVQWLAPVASEAPELLIACLFAWRLKTTDALATLLSSKVNQWTLLVGTLPVVFALASGSAHGLPVTDEQREELFLTAAQSAYAVCLLAGLTITVRGAASLAGLFVAQFVVEAVTPSSAHGLVLVALSVAYLALAGVMLVRRRRQLRPVIRDGLRTPYPTLIGEPAGAVEVS
jgi:cation:H+ antiporter